MKENYRIRPWFEGGVVIFALILGGMSLTFFHHDPQTSILMLLIMTIFGGGFAWIGIRTWNSIYIIDNELRVQTFSTEHLFSTGDVASIRVCRASKIFMFNEIELVIRGYRCVTLMRYIGFGRSILIEARSLAERLDVPLIDRGGERLQMSRLAPLRWRAKGDEWAFQLCICLPVILLSVLIAVLLQSRHT